MLSVKECSSKRNALIHAHSHRNKSKFVPKIVHSDFERMPALVKLASNGVGDDESEISKNELLVEPISTFSFHGESVYILQVPSWSLDQD